MLNITALSRTLGGRRLPDRVDLAVEPGTTLVLLGASGAGKTALLRCIAGLDTPDSGGITLGGEPLHATPAHLRPVAYIAQGATLWPQMTVRANLAFGLESRGLPPAIVRARVDAALARFGVEALAERRPATLSGGEQQRVALARALASEPALLLLDEPFAWLAATERAGLTALLREYARATGAIVLIAARDAAVALDHADLAAVMDAGRIIQTDTPSAIFRRPVNRAAALALGPANLLAATVVRSGAGEFLASSSLGELRGALADPDSEPDEGAPILVMIRPADLRLADMPPDENAYAGTLAETIPGRPLTRFLAEGGTVLHVFAPHATTDPAGCHYAWAFPEDVVGLAADA